MLYTLPFTAKYECFMKSQNQIFAYDLPKSMPPLDKKLPLQLMTKNIVLERLHLVKNGSKITISKRQKN